MSDDVYRAEIQTLTLQVGLLAERIHQAVPCRYCPARVDCPDKRMLPVESSCRVRIVQWSRDRAEKKGRNEHAPEGLPDCLPDPHTARAGGMPVGAWPVLGR
jgi:hypothetical protein